jgi:hypothetical protein
MLSVETLRESVQELRDAATRLDSELIKAGDLPPELFAEVLLLTLKQKDKLLEATEEVHAKGASLFAASNRAEGVGASDNTWVWFRGPRVQLLEERAEAGLALFVPGDMVRRDPAAAPRGHGCWRR